MKDLFRISTLLEGPSLGKLPRIKLPKVVTTELVSLMQKASKVLDHYLDLELEETKNKKEEN